ncbi:MAG: transcriptional regulator [Gammaproteobacteria bacterium]|nr:MAG: transcriptional regulator [Gammaproteobacteria bacterium]
MTDYLALLNTLDENERLEAKRGSGIGPAVLESVCAFANEPGLKGGTILLGIAIDENDLFSQYAVEGVENPDELSATLASRCRSQFNIPVRVQISSEQISGKTILVVTVPEAQPGDKPVFIKSKGLPKGAYRRIGSTDQQCTEDDLLALYQGRQNESFDYTVLPDSSFADFSSEAIAGYREVRALVNRDAEELLWNDEELLEALGCVRRKDGELRPTVAGLLLFGKTTSLRRVFPMTRVDYIRVPGKEWISDPENRFDSIEIRDHLFRVIRRVLATVLDDLPKAFGLTEGNPQRTERPLIPQRVLREGIVNALMHRSYRSHAPIQIIRYSNRIEILNPGHSLKSPEQLGEPGSVPRNPRLAAVMLDTRFAETKGSGIRVMREMMMNAGLEPPLFESLRSEDQFAARYYFQHFLNDEAVRWLSRFRDLQLTDEEARALVAVREQGAIDNAMYRELNRVDTLAASQSLRRLRDVGLLEQRGRSSATHYKPTDWLLGTSDRSGDGFGSKSGSSEDLSSNLSGLSSNPSGLSSNLESLSSNPEGLTGSLDDARQEARRKLLNELPNELAERIGSLGRRRPPDILRDVVLELCCLRSYRTEELAVLLVRNVETVRQNYLRPLLREGRLSMSKPDKPNDPDQAYQTTDE